MKTVFYIGRAYPHLDALQRLKNLGYNVGIFRDSTHTLKNEAFFDWVIDLDFSSEELFAEKLKNITLPHIDGLMCVYENYIPFKAIAAQVLELPAISVESARACTDKYVMRTRFLERDPSITPLFCRVDSAATLLNFAKIAGYPLVLKPTNLMKSLLVSKCNDEKSLLRAYEDTVSRIDEVYQRVGISSNNPGIIAEQFIEGKMCSVAAFVDDKGGVHLCDGVVSLTTAQQIGRNDNFLYLRELSTELDAQTKALILQVAREGTEALAVKSSPAHIEIIYNADGAKIVEIGARTGGYRSFLYRESYDIDLLEQEALIAIGGMPDLQGTFQNHSAVFELFPEREGEFIGVEPSLRSTDYEYLHQVASPGKFIGKAQDGYKAAAVIGIVDASDESFRHRINEIDKIKVKVR